MAFLASLSILPTSPPTPFSTAHAFVFFKDPDGTIQLVFNRDSNDGLFNIPGGHKENTETEVDTISREFGEELGLEFPVDQAQRLGTLEIGTARFPIYAINLLSCPVLNNWPQEVGSVEIGIVSLETFLLDVPPDSPFYYLMSDFKKYLAKI